MGKTVEEVLLELGWEKSTELLFVHRRQRLVLSAYVDDS